MGYGSTKPTGLQFDLKNSRLQPKFKKAQTTYSFLYIHILILEYLEIYIFKKRLDNYIIFLFSSIYSSYFPISLTISLQFPYVSFPPLSCSLCFPFCVLPFMSLFSRFFIFLIFLRSWTSLLWTVRASSPLFPHSKIWVGKLESFSHPSVHTRYTGDTKPDEKQI